MEFLSVHYDEIALKGNNRGRFERLLIKNIERTTGTDVERLSGRLIINNPNEKTTEILRITPGVSWFGDSVRIERSIDKLLSTLKSIEGVENARIDVKRIDKTYEHTSLEVNEMINEAIRPHGEKTRIRVEIFPDSFVITKAIERGPGGLPIGVAGKVLSLFSGGIDSSTAPFELMKRGSIVDLLHVYALPDAEMAMKSKIGDILNRMSMLNPVRIYLVPFSVFSLKTVNEEGGFDLVLFKRYLLKLAERVADMNGYKAIATGDSLSQVASQTLSNINAISYGIDLPVLRPFITANKDEIISLSKRYGVYQFAIEEYKDCCSIVSRHPRTGTSQEKVKELEERVGMETLIDDSIKKMEERTIKTSTD